MKATLPKNISLHETAKEMHDDLVKAGGKSSLTKKHLKYLDKKIKQNKSKKK